jgi:cytochrome c oxidase cbb3-type subunit 2
MTALTMTGVPYTDEMIAKAKADLEAQVNPDAKGAKELLARYPKAQVRNFDGQPDTTVTELDALVAYLQVLGTLVDFTSFDASGPNLR